MSGSPGKTWKPTSTLLIREPIEAGVPGAPGAPGESIVGESMVPVLRPWSDCARSPMTVERLTDNERERKVSIDWVLA